MHRRTAGIDIGQGVGAVLILECKLNAVPQREKFQGAIDDGIDPGEIDGLDQKVVGAQAHGFDGVFDRPIGGQHDDERLRGKGADFSQCLDAAHAGHFEIQENEVGGLLRDGTDQVFSGFKAGNRMVAP